MWHSLNPREVTCHFSAAIISVRGKSIHSHAVSTFSLPLPWGLICLWPIQFNYFVNLFVNQFSWLMQTSGCWEQHCKICVEVQIPVVAAAAGSWKDHSRDPTVATPAERVGYSVVQELLRRPGMIPNTGAIWTCKLWLLQTWSFFVWLVGLFSGFFASVAKGEENHQNMKS